MTTLAAALLFAKGQTMKRLSDTMFVAPQISPDDVAQAAASGITLIINNRPDGEDPGQPSGAEVAAAAAAAGVAYVAIPVTQAGFSMPQVEAMADAMAASSGAVLAYCRSGTRSTNLWALAKAHGGEPAEVLIDAAASADYDISPLGDMLAMLANRRS